MISKKPVTAKVNGSVKAPIKPQAQVKVTRPRVTAPVIVKKAY